MKTNGTNDLEKKQLERMRSYLFEEKTKRIPKLKRSCFADSLRLTEATFANDAHPDALGAVARRYVSEWGHNLKEGRSILFYGETGTGKTFSAACIVNELYDTDVHRSTDYDIKIKYVFVPSLELAQRDEKAELLKEVRASNFVFIDEWDARSIRSNESKNFFLSLFDIMYENRIPFVITTNESPELMDADRSRDDAFSKIYDRITHQCAHYGFHKGKIHIRRELAALEHGASRSVTGDNGRPIEEI